MQTNRVHCFTEKLSTKHYSAMVSQVSRRERGVISQRHRQRIPMVLCPVLVIFVVILSVVHTAGAQTLNKNNGIMLPNVKQRVIDAGSNFSIVCIFEHQDEIAWVFPDYFEFSQVSLETAKLIKCLSS